jgi:hypothetical protein
MPLRSGKLFRVDGILQVANNSIMVEVKKIPRRGVVVEGIRREIDRIIYYRDMFENTSQARFILALVFDEDIQWSAINQIINKNQQLLQDKIEVRPFSLRALLEKYGLPHAREDADAAATPERAEELVGARRSRLRAASSDNENAHQR